MKKILLFLFILGHIACKNDSTIANTEAPVEIPAAKEQNEQTLEQRKKYDKVMSSRDVHINFAGKYNGKIPCIDCQEIHINLDVKNDHSYTLSGNYDGKKSESFSYKGKYTIINYIIHLDHDQLDVKYFYIAENGLYVLNEKKQQIAGSNKEQYLITKG